MQLDYLPSELNVVNTETKTLLCSCSRQIYLTHTHTHTHTHTNITQSSIKIKINEAAFTVFIIIEMACNKGFFPSFPLEQSHHVA